MTVRLVRYFAYFLLTLPAAYGRRGCKTVNYMEYCNPVDEMVISNVGFTGGYYNPTHMDYNQCQCQSEWRKFSGPLAPFNEPLSLHLRGPINLLKGAVYMLENSPKLFKRDNEQSTCVKKRKSVIAVTKTITKTVERTVYRSYLSGHSTPRKLSPDISSAHKSADYHNFTIAPYSESVKSTTSSQNSDTEIPTPASRSMPDATSQSDSNGMPVYKRTAHFDSAAQVSDNMIFTNNLGGVVSSGSWTSCFGNTLCYAGKDGVSAAASPQILDGTRIPSGKEIAIFSGKPCSNSTCPFTRPKAPAFEGFGGADKVFLLEFMMPIEENVDPGSFQADMPAIWLLNANIPHAVQYGNPNCSCWTTGCGEFDLLESLYTGSPHLKTTIHTWQGTGNPYGGGGSPDYFERPVDAPMKVAVVFSSETRSIKIVKLASDTIFSESIAASVINQWSGKRKSEIELQGGN